MIQVGVAVAATVYEDDFKGVLTKGMGKSIEKYDSVREVMQGWDNLQSHVRMITSIPFK